MPFVEGRSELVMTTVSGPMQCSMSITCQQQGRVSAWPGTVALPEVMLLNRTGLASHCPLCNQSSSSQEWPACLMAFQRAWNMAHTWPGLWSATFSQALRAESLNIVRKWETHPNSLGTGKLSSTSEEQASLHACSTFFCYLSVYLLLSLYLPTYILTSYLLREGHTI